MLKVYNVLSRKKEEFVTLEKGLVKMYACGITVSGDAHIGHAYQAIVFDMIRKYLEYIGYKVIYVRNYTDVDDKIIEKANKLGEKPLLYAEKMIEKTEQEFKKLGVDEPTIQARATECINDMISFIEKLIAKEHAYVTETGDVYFKVNSFKNYGKFSNRLVEESISGVRKEIEPGKLDEHDFALWKSVKENEIFWESPWGKGRPGWHIECSAMSLKYLGEEIDIHGGGEDLLFPHHENEIAQTESLTGKRFAKYWLHNGLVNINSQKMSKSLGNTILLEDLIRQYNSDVIKMTLLQNNYRSNINIIDGMFEINENKVYRFYKMFKEIDEFENNKGKNDVFEKIEKEFKEAMNNDFNTPVAFANLFKYFSEMEQLVLQRDMQKLSAYKKSIVNIYRVLGLFQQDSSKVIEEIKNKYLKKNKIDEKEILSLIEKRNGLKKIGNYQEADLVRDDLLKKGVSIKDTREGAEWDIEIK